MSSITQRPHGGGEWLLPLGPSDRLLRALIFWQKLPVIGKVLRQLLRFRGTDIPPETLQPGTGLAVPHGGHVTVHYTTRIGRNVQLFQHATIGRADVWRAPAPDYDGVEIRDGAVIGAGAAVLCQHGRVVIGEGAVIAANSVVTRSVPAGEIWGGVPARRMRLRDEH